VIGEPVSVPSAQVNVTFKKAPKAKGPATEQLSLGAEASDDV
jgi:hypothetical protein